MKKTDSKAKRQPANSYHCDGFTLIEMLAVMALMSILFTASVTTFAFLMRVEVQGTERIQNHLILQKLSHQYREDVRASQSASTQNLGQLKLEQRDKVLVVYLSSQSGNAVRREVRQEEKIVSENEYPLPLGNMKFETKKIDQQELVSLELQLLDETNHENQALKPFYRVFRVDSHLNHNNQLLSELNKKSPDSK